VTQPELPPLLPLLLTPHSQCQVSSLARVSACDVCTFILTHAYTLPPIYPAPPSLPPALSVFTSVSPSLALSLVCSLSLRVCLSLFHIRPTHRIFCSREPASGSSSSLFFPLYSSSCASTAEMPMYTYMHKQMDRYMCRWIERYAQSRQQT